MTQELHLLNLRRAMSAPAGILDLVSFTANQFGVSYTYRSLDEETRMSRDLLRSAATHWGYTSWRQKR
jgi:hypothetical protein